MPSGKQSRRQNTAIMVFGDDLRIICWYDGAEQLTGIPAGRPSRGGAGR